MKTWLLHCLFIFLLFPYASLAQEFTYPVANSNDLTIRIQVGFTELNVFGVPENSIEIRSFKEVRSTDSRADGLAPLTPWPDNTGLGLHLSEKEGEVIIFKTGVRSAGRFEIKVPESAYVIIDETEWGRGDFKVQDLNGDVSIESNSSDIEIDKISGSIHAKTTSGQLTVVLPPSVTEGIKNKHRISSVSGKINLMIDKNAAYNFELGTVSGLIKTDFEVTSEVEYKGSILKRLSKSRKIETDLNGGGDKVEAETVSGILTVLYKQ